MVKIIYYTAYMKLKAYKYENQRIISRNKYLFF